jgi:hypothetical protein
MLHEGHRHNAQIVSREDEISFSSGNVGVRSLHRGYAFLAGSMAAKLDIRSVYIPRTLNITDL